jgi:aspartate-semialdehyde dehydrogenase
MSSSQDPIRVGILGATGAVGQQFVRLLGSHPWFRVTALAASPRSAGKPYREAAHWLHADPIPAAVADLVVQPTEPGLDCDLVFSGLDASVAGEAEEAFARAGYAVVSNARNHRMAPDVPLLIPEVNPDHLALAERQAFGGGLIVTNPNCSTVGLVSALAPLHRRWGVERAQVTTLQALSGAGYPGVASLDALGNVVPFIGGEEEKLATEPLKLLGTLGEGGVAPAEFVVSAQCNRVPVVDGHTLCVSVTLGGDPSADEVAHALRTAPNPLDGLDLPTAPERAVEVLDDPAHPQPRLHVGRGRGMTTTVGRIQPCPVGGVKFVALVHNTVRGAAGGAILNAELMAARGLLGARYARRTGAAAPQPADA